MQISLEKIAKIPQKFPQKIKFNFHFNETIRRNLKGI